LSSKLLVICALVFPILFEFCLFVWTINLFSNTSVFLWKWVIAWFNPGVRQIWNIQSKDDSQGVRRFRERCSIHSGWRNAFPRKYYISASWTNNVNEHSSKSVTTLMLAEDMLKTPIIIHMADIKICGTFWNEIIVVCPLVCQQSLIQLC